MAIDRQVENALRILEYVASREFPNPIVPMSSRLAAGYRHQVVPLNQYDAIERELRSPASRFRWEGSVPTRANRPSSLSMALGAVKEAKRERHNAELVLREMLQYGVAPDPSQTYRYALSVVRDQHGELVGVSHFTSGLKRFNPRTGEPMRMTQAAYMAVLPTVDKSVTNYLSEEVGAKAFSIGEGVMFERLRYKGRGIDSPVIIPPEQLRSKLAYNAVAAKPPLMLPPGGAASTYEVLPPPPPQLYGARALARLQETNRAAGAAGIAHRTNAFRGARPGLRSLRRLIGRF